MRKFQHVTVEEVPNSFFLQNHIAEKPIAKCCKTFSMLCPRLPTVNCYRVARLALLTPNFTNLAFLEAVRKRYQTGVLAF